MAKKAMHMATAYGECIAMAMISATVSYVQHCISTFLTLQSFKRFATASSYVKRKLDKVADLKASSGFRSLSLYP